MDREEIEKDMIETIKEEIKYRFKPGEYILAENIPILIASLIDREG